MSVTISNCDDICHSPTNQSKAKHLYTFSRGHRFPSRRIIQCDKYYDCKPLHTCRTTSMGFGNKYDFTKDVPKSPSPNNYNLKSDFDQNQKKGYGFGNGRGQMEITGPFVQSIKDKNPGPGTYDRSSSLNSARTFTLTGKNYQQDQEKKKIPGPGTYPTTFGINQKGIYSLSKFKNSCVRNFNNNSEQRAKIVDNKVPGPGFYNTKNSELSPEGKYCLSKMSSSRTRRFGTSGRSAIVRQTDTPGPGNYRVPSEFGYYMAKNAVEKPKTEETGRRKHNKQDKQNIN